MSEETKRLLKCDLRYVFKDALVFVLIMAGLQLWCYLLYDKVANMVLLVSFITSLILLSIRAKDWQVQIRMYVSSGMSRKVIFQVLNIRNAILFLAGMLIEVVMCFVSWNGFIFFRIEFFVISGAFLLFIWGFGEIMGVLVYQRKKLGLVLMVIGYLPTTIFCMAAIGLEDEPSYFWDALFDKINVLPFVAVAVAVLAGGIFLAKKQLGKYMVY